QSPPLVRPHQMEARITLHSGGNPEQRSPRVDLPWQCGTETVLHIQRREVRMDIAVNEARTETAPAQIVAPPLAPKPTSDRNVAARARAQHACRASEVDVWPPTILNPVRTALSICGDSTSSPISRRNRKKIKIGVSATGLVRQMRKIELKQQYRASVNATI